MRDPFPYESNARLIRRIIVPSLLSPPEWDAIHREWRTSGNNSSLLEYIVTHSLKEDDVLEVLHEATGAELITDPIFSEGDQLDAMGHMLLQHGFKPLASSGSRRFLAGGPDLNPDLRLYLGSDAGIWQWVLVSPNRGIENGRAEPLMEERNFASSEWLRELIISRWTNGARDLHFENHHEELCVRARYSCGMRIIGKWQDGRGATVERLLTTWAGIPNRQINGFADGRLKLSSSGSNIELRISMVPTINGSSIVIRAPSSHISNRSLSELGLPELMIREILDIVRHRPGLILCTGRTGSGKTTTLYGILAELRDANLKILTIEDPVELIVPHAVQSNVDEHNGWTFDKAVYSYLRQDPDVIMIGEIRDRDSAEAACRAALTGHCVISTMHAGGESLAVNRLRAWGIAEGVLLESVRMVINQKLTSSPRETRTFTRTLYK